MFSRIKDLTLLLARVDVAVVFIHHGLMKWNNGIAATTAFFQSVGVPLPSVAVIFTMAVELLGSLAFIIGFALPLVGIGYVVVAGGALITAGLDTELVIVLALAGLALGFNGGRYSLDHLLFWSKRESRELLPA